MRITDVLRGQINSQVEVVAGRESSETEASIPVRILRRLIRQHIRTMQPVLDLMSDRLGEGGFLAILRLDRGVLERDLQRLEASAERARPLVIRALTTRFTDHLTLCLHVALAVADRCLTETELLRLGALWGKEAGLVLADPKLPPAPGPGAGPAPY